MPKNMIPPWRPLYYYTNNIHHTPNFTKILHTLLLQYMRSATVVLISLYISPETTHTTTTRRLHFFIFVPRVTSSKHNIDLLASNNSFLWQLFASYIYDKWFRALVLHYQLSLPCRTPLTNNIPRNLIEKCLPTTTLQLNQH